MSAPQAGVGVGRGRGRGRGGNVSGGGGGSGTGSRERGHGWYGRGTSKGRALAATPRGPSGRSGRGDVPDSGRRRWVPAVRPPRSPFAGYIAGSSVRYRNPLPGVEGRWW